MLIRINRLHHRIMKLVILVLASAWLLPTTIILAQAPVGLLRLIWRKEILAVP